MRNLKSIILLSFLLVLFVGNVGVNIFKHVCAEDGVSISYFIQGPDECEEHHDIEPACCSESASDKDDDCCSDIVSYLSVELDYFESFDSIDIDPMQLATIVNFSFDFNSVGFKEVYVAHTYDDPPPKDSQTTRISYQVFLI